MITRGQVRTREKIRDLIDEAARAGDALVVHTLVRSNLRQFMRDEARARGVDSMDLLGPMLDRLVTRLNFPPRQMPGLMKQLLKAQSRKAEAVEFAFRHDDGQHIEELKKAEVVLIGVSRTMKTPTMLYLAYRGWFAANVPIVMELPIPVELIRLPPHKVVCLSTTANHLLETRRARAKAFRIPEKPYASMEHIRNELRYCRKITLEYGWPQIDITGKSVEEVARDITDILPDNRNAFGPSW